VEGLGLNEIIDLSRLLFPVLSEEVVLLVFRSSRLFNRWLCTWIAMEGLACFWLCRVMELLRRRSLRRWFIEFLISASEEPLVTKFEGRLLFRPGLSESRKVVLAEAAKVVLFDIG